MMDRGERLDWWDAFEILAYLALIVAAFWVFVVDTMTHEKPFINPRLFLDRNFSIGLVLVFIYGMLNITPTVLIPTMLQNLMGYPDSMIGLLLASRGTGMVIGFSRLPKWLNSILNWYDTRGRRHRDLGMEYGPIQPRSGPINHSF